MIEAPTDLWHDTSVIDVQDNVHQITVDPDGLYYAEAKSRDQKIRFIVDSGANTTIITQSDARRLGIDPRTLQYREKLVTANGSAPLAFVHIASLTIAGKTYSQVQVAVFGRKGGVSLLGQDMLRRFRRFAIEDGVMTLA
ncbi:clan AA aspartic protease (TIGR02281 family) [Sphingomonas vulcanisoli]|uniref:Clan AA aspartic protease (TIGR02281 family) n=1 Tax=Sphingomonas vulcanisoli TaxID=1658060 RepID=A0ABX0TUV7_9SPHN|nr:clan AA aspartic protease (TIGR02281 family) [Sphingomonas vulcanisoli]